MAQSLGMAERGAQTDARDLLGRFDPAKLPREPTVFSATGQRL
jgi:hypothetical protein